ncbi:class I SAM-dependent methyltransferase [Iamia sp. SCSIO 61187]|uniref:class I SAM-dependent DNA methyltransferase n=1 Tax=Iamia sp. SCSIO 61187 TaxID=2722752 RepID=UPI001C62E91A|nr:class I SAM-dependent methyltransferase [Iamia sp. SCSIO 61187]QYG92118.1 class I SAM-dependent methyltransferase [Iamia sp. SCSIO 61187]
MTPDPIFAHPRLADVYDDLDPDRSDLDAYVAIVEELGARSVLDVGCGTGALAVLLAGRGVEVVGLDPAAASLAVARRKPGADRVCWIEGDATTLAIAVPPERRVDLAVMTGNVAQVFTTDDAWAAALAGIGAALGPGGHVVFETRRPEVRVWEQWTPDRTCRTAEVAGVGTVVTWCEVITVDEPLVSFRWWFRFTSGGELLASDSTIRFRTRAELEASLALAGFTVDDVRDAPDRPGLEMVVVAHRS